jgi:chorismate synthase
MAGNTFGTLFKITTFGESHGAAMGVVIDGCLPGLEVDHALIKQDLARRKPGQNALTTSRNEPEEYEILSGIFEGKTLGTPIAIIIRNKDQHSSDYDKLKDVFRPSHADYTYQMKYGFRDYRGGGRQSARETVSRVLAGSFAKMILAKLGVSVQAAVTGVGLVESHLPVNNLDFAYAEANLIRCGDPNLAADMINAIEKARDAGDTLGGTISCACIGTHVGWGEPVFDKLNADLAKAMLSINAVKAFEMGAGMESTRKKGSELNDAFENLDGKIVAKSNNSGGVQGGISNGETIWFKVGFKPVASIKQEQTTVNMRHENVRLTIDGRHDPCVVPRAVPIVEAMAAIVFVDHYLRQLPNSMQLF